MGGVSRRLIRLWAAELAQVLTSLHYRWVTCIYIDIGSAYRIFGRGGGGGGCNLVFCSFRSGSRKW